MTHREGRVRPAPDRGGHDVKVRDATWTSINSTLDNTARAIKTRHLDCYLRFLPAQRLEGLGATFFLDAKRFAGMYSTGPSPGVWSPGLPRRLVRSSIPLAY